MLLLLLDILDHSNVDWCKCRRPVHLAAHICRHDIDRYVYMWYRVGFREGA